MAEFKYFDRELSWLSFNQRVLQEAADPRVPLLERIRFLAIYSANLDEFFRVRVASLRSLVFLKKKSKKELDFKPKALLKRINKTAFLQQEEFGRIWQSTILPELHDKGVFLLKEKDLTPEQRTTVFNYFQEKVRGKLKLIPLWEGGTPFLENRKLYHVVEFRENNSEPFTDSQYTLVEIPSDELPRFFQFTTDGKTHNLIFLDEIVRIALPEIFPSARISGCHSVKLSRDAEMYIEDEFEGDLVGKIREGISRRATGLPSRFLYDSEMPHYTLLLLKEELGLTDYEMIPGGRYHNLNDFFQFPNPEGKLPEYQPMPPLPGDEWNNNRVFERLRKGDVLLSYPYQSFDPVISFFREAATDPGVQEICATLYRVSKDSEVVNALLQAAQNGKSVSVFVEVKARFDEAPNLFWAGEMEKAGIKVLYSIPGIKVHSKLAVVRRKEADSIRTYAYLATGNLNEKTARIYGDHGLFTANPYLADEAREVFRMLETRDFKTGFRHLLVAPSHLRKGFTALVDEEIKAAKRGEEAWMLLKMNSLEDTAMVDKLYEASQAGVKIRIMVRGICVLLPGIPDLSEHIQVISIVGRFLEHARAFVFHHGGKEKVYLASADWMGRNLDRRVEVAFPVYDPDSRILLRRLLEIQWSDNQKARLINKEQDNPYVDTGKGPDINAQEAIYSFLKGKG
jgi:polyphosphate kinase